MSRWFFAGIGVWSIVLSLAGFGPIVMAHVRGQAYIPPMAYAHGAVMTAWLLVYTAQGTLVRRGALRAHRRLGRIGVMLAVAVWLSMAVATVTALQRFDVAKYAFLVRPLLVQISSMVLFPIFFAWAVLARREPAWHKRLMTLATFVLVQAALDRMRWLPHEGLPMFWHLGVRAYVALFLPLFVFDLVTLRRIHAATLVGTSLVIVSHGVITFYWQHEGWYQVARSFWTWLR